MRRAIKLMTGIAVATLAVCLAMPLHAQESGESTSERPPVRVAVMKPTDAAPKRPRIRVRLVTAEQAGLPVSAFAAGDDADSTTPANGADRGAVDIFVSSSELPAADAAGAPAEPSAQSNTARAGDGPSLFDQLVAPSWSGGGGFDRAPWPEQSTGTAQTPGPEREVTNVVVASSPSPGAVLPATPALTPGAAGSGQPGSLAPVAGGDYRLGPGDRVDVFVWRNTDLSRVVPVRPDGRITLPLAGEIVATGKTVAMLQEEITARLSDYVQMPTVTVTLSEIRSLVIYVLGDVRTPGAVQMDRNLTVLQAIAAAGGLNEFADRNDIVVMRTNADGVHQRWSFRYDDVVEGKQLSSNIVLQAGDTIIVP